MTGGADPWASFTRDPRQPEHATLRAADADRDVVHQLLAEAYADGRLDRDELDARTSAVVGARTLGDLPPILEGLVLTSAVPALPGAAGPLSTTEIEERAVAKWRSQRTSALMGFLFLSSVCWTIWVVGSWGPDGFDPYFPWPVFVTLVTGINAIKTTAEREEIVMAERRRLEKKQRKELERRRAEGEQ